MGTVLKPVLQETPGTPPSYNFGMSETFSFIPIEGAGRPLFARASYITNFSDMSIHLSAGELSIGAVTIKDNNTGLNCDVVSDPANGLNALRVITQDSESIYDNITLGDKGGINFATINEELSALNVKIANNGYDEKNDNIISLLNALTAKEYVFQVDAENLVLPDDTNILFDTTPIEIPLIQNSVLLNSLTALQEKEFNETQNLLNSLTALQEKEFNETQNLLNSLTALQENKQNSQITLLNSISSQNLFSSQILSSISINSQDLKNSLIYSNTLLQILTGQEISLYNQISSLPLQTEKISLQLNVLSSINLNTKQVENEIKTSNTLLNSLTSKEIIFNTVPLESRLEILSSINLQTKNLEILLGVSNTLLNELTAKETNVNINTSNTLLNQLTSLEAANSQQSITLFSQLTSQTNQLEPLLLQSNNLVQSLTSQNLEELRKVQTLLHSLTSIDYSTKNKQQETLTVLHHLTGNTNEVESLIVQSNTLVNSLTSLQLIKFNETQNLLETQNRLISSIDTFVSTQSVKISSSSLESLLQSVNLKLDSLITRSDQQLGLMGLDVLESGITYTGYWTTLTVISLSAKFLSLGAINSSTSNLSGYELPLTFTLSGPLTSIRLQYGAVIAYH